MSWLFGSRSQSQDFSQFVPPSTPGGGDNDKKIGHKIDAYKFDSAALEKTAKAVKDLEKSAFAQQAMKLQEERKQREIIAKAKEFELQIERRKLEGIRVDAEEHRKSREKQAILDQQKAQYQDKLTRKRYDDQLLQWQRMEEENLRKQEESVAKQQTMKKATIDHELENNLKCDLKLLAKMKAKAKIERENHHLTLEQIKLEAERDRETTLKSLREERETILATLSSINSISSAIGSSLISFLSDPKKVATAVGGAVVLTTGYYSTKRILRLTFKFIKARIGTPSLVRETTRIVLTDDFLKHPIQTAKKLKRISEDVWF